VIPNGAHGRDDHRGRLAAVGPTIAATAPRLATSAPGSTWRPLRPLLRPSDPRGPGTTRSVLPLRPRGRDSLASQQLLDVRLSASPHLRRDTGRALTRPLTQQSLRPLVDCLKETRQFAESS
jgi:hypothetical protein